MPGGAYERAKGIIHRLRIFEYSGDLRIEDDDIRACLIALELLAPHSFRKVIVPLNVIDPRIACAPLGWQAEHL
jgi:hypothetical protein